MIVNFIADLVAAMLPAMLMPPITTLKSGLQPLCF